MAVIIGLDPGSRFTGYGVIEVVTGQWRHLEHGVVEIPEKLPFAARLAHLAAGLKPVFLRWPAQTVAVEKVFLGKNADSAFKLGHARGVCLLLAAEAGCEVVEYATRSAKKIVTGSGAATKEHVAAVVSQLLRLKTSARLDATDALALALCHAREAERQEMLKKMERMSL